MIRFLFVIVALGFFVPSAAYASNWLECKVHAEVKRSLDTGLYRTEIKGAIVSDGVGKVGGPCLQKAIGKTVDLQIKGNPPEGKTVRLKYRTSSAMGENGAVISESWSYWPPGIKDLAPW